MATKTLTEDDLGLFVLDALSNDIESIESILSLINSDEYGWKNVVGRAFVDKEIKHSLKRLIDKKWVNLLVYDPRLAMAVKSVTDSIEAHEETWFQMTDLGRTVWMEWEVPKEWLRHID
jgi:hypothetical protein